MKCNDSAPLEVCFQSHRHPAVVFNLSHSDKPQKTSRNILCLALIMPLATELPEMGNTTSINSDISNQYRRVDPASNNSFAQMNDLPCSGSGHTIRKHPHGGLRSRATQWKCCKCGKAAMVSPLYHAMEFSGVDSVSEHQRRCRLHQLRLSSLEVLHLSYLVKGSALAYMALEYRDASTDTGVWNRSLACTICSSLVLLCGYLMERETLGNGLSGGARTVGLVRGGGRQKVMILSQSVVHRQIDHNTFFATYANVPKHVLPLG